MAAELDGGGDSPPVVAEGLGVPPADRGHTVTACEHATQVCAALPWNLLLSNPQL